MSKTKNCSTCGKLFEYRRSTKTYCSRRCVPREIARRKAYKRCRDQIMVYGPHLEELGKIQINKPENMVLDHIIPRNHPKVTGLHVPWNIQYLSKEDNERKGSKWDGTYTNEGWKSLLS